MVSEYMNEPLLQVGIDGPNSVSPYNSGLYSANVQNCSQSTSYSWSVNEGNGSFQNLGTSASVTYNAGDVYDASLRLIMTCGNETKTVFKYISVGGGNDPDCGFEIQCLKAPPGKEVNETMFALILDDSQENTPSGTSILYPNPSNEANQTTILFSAPTIIRTMRVTTTASGAVVWSENFDDRPISSVKRIFTLPSGVYTVEIVTPESIMYHALIVQK